MTHLFAEAEQRLLVPAGLNEQALQQVFSRLHSHAIDDADLYFQFTRSEGWSLEEGIVKSGSHSIDQGVGVRAICGDKTAFAYSDDISLPALLAAADTTRAIAQVGQSQQIGLSQRAQGHQLYAGIDPIPSLDSAAKIALLEKVEQLARAQDPRVKQVMAGLAAEYDVVYLARLDGTRAADVRPLVRLSVMVIVEQDGRREQGSAGGGGRFDFAHFTEARLLDTHKESHEK